MAYPPFNVSLTATFSYLQVPMLKLFLSGALQALLMICAIGLRCPLPGLPLSPRKGKKKSIFGMFFFQKFRILSLFFLIVIFFLVFVVVFIRLKRPEEGFRRYREIFSVMHSRILWWLESWQDVFHPSPGVFRFPLVHQEDAPFVELFFAPPLLQGWHEEFEFSDDSDELSEFEDFDYVQRKNFDKTLVKEEELSVCGGGILNINSF